MDVRITCSLYRFAKAQRSSDVNAQIRRKPHRDYNFFSSLENLQDEHREKGHDSPLRLRAGEKREKKSPSVKIELASGLCSLSGKCRKNWPACLPGPCRVRKRQAFCIMHRAKKEGFCSIPRRLIFLRSKFSTLSPHEELYQTVISMVRPRARFIFVVSPGGISGHLINCSRSLKKTLSPKTSGEDDFLLSCQKCLRDNFSRGT